MARKVEELLVEIDGDNRKFKNALRGAEGAADSFGSKMGRGLGNVTRVAGTAALAIGAVGAAAVGFGLNIAAETEKAESAFTTLLGSAEAAQEFITQLRDFAAKTPFEFAGVRHAAQQFVAMGFSAQEVVPILTAVGDAVGAMGGGQEEIDGVTRALTQMQAKGKVSAEEMLQLAERGIPAWQFLAEKMGTDIPTAMEEVSKGAVEAGVFISAFMEGSASRFGGAMEKQSQTLAGLFSTLKDTISVSLGEAAQGLIEPLKAAMPVISQVLGDVIGTALPPLVEGLAALMPAILALVPTIGAIAGVIGDVLGFLSPILADIATAFSTLFAGLDLSLLDDLKPTFEALAAVAKALLPILARLAGEVFESLVAVVASLAPVLLVVADILTFLAPVLPELLEGIILVVAALKVWAIAQGILNIVLTANPIGIIIVAIGALVGGIIFLVRNVEGLSGVFSKTWEAIKTAVSAAVAFMVDAFFKFHPLGIFIKHFDAIRDFFTGLVEDFKDFGKDIIAGLVSGITGAAGDVKDAVTGAASDAWAGAKNFLGISSPSKKFMELGKFSVEGFMQPFGSVGGKVVDALAPVGNTQAPSPTGAASRSSGTSIVFEAGAFRGAFEGATLQNQSDLEGAVRRVMQKALRGAL